MDDIHNTMDLLITDNDLTIVDGQTVNIDGSNAIAQDIQHMIREKGYAVQMIGNRDAIEVANLMLQIEMEIEKDRRILPGTATVYDLGGGQILAEANTIYDHPIKIGVTSNA